MPDHSRRFEGLAGAYVAYRPDYPAGLLKRLATDITASNRGAGGRVLDVGAGTGIFTRQLRSALGDGACLVGVEPSSDMRAKALEGEAGTSHAIDYVDGVAEALPFADVSIQAVVAATAAHWFDRPAFYREAARVLERGGLLAIAEYVRDENASALAADLVRALARNGGARAYDRPDYEAELRMVAGFTDATAHRWPTTLMLTPAQFIGLALSSSHARAWVERDGRHSVELELFDLSQKHARADGLAPFGYMFQLFEIRRA